MKESKSGQHRPQQQANGIASHAQRLKELDQRQDETSRAGPDLKTSFSRRSQQVLLPSAALPGDRACTGPA